MHLTAWSRSVPLCWAPFVQEGQMWWTRHSRLGNVYGGLCPVTPKQAGLTETLAENRFLRFSFFLLGQWMLCQPVKGASHSADIHWVRPALQLNCDCIPKIQIIFRTITGDSNFVLWLENVSTAKENTFIGLKVFPTPHARPFITKCKTVVHSSVQNKLHGNVIILSSAEQFGKCKPVPIERWWDAWGDALPAQLSEARPALQYPAVDPH